MMFYKETNMIYLKMNNLKQCDYFYVSIKVTRPAR